MVYTEVTGRDGAQVPWKRGSEGETEIVRAIRQSPTAISWNAAARERYRYADKGQRERRKGEG